VRFVVQRHGVVPCDASRSELSESGTRRGTDRVGWDDCILSERKLGGCSGICLSALERD
jgi:hypothetical protein